MQGDDFGVIEGKRVKKLIDHRGIRHKSIEIITYSGTSSSR